MIFTDREHQRSLLRYRNTYLNLGLEMHCLLLLPNLLFLLVRIVRNVNFDTQLIPQSVDARTLGTNNASDEFSVDIELGRL